MATSLTKLFLVYFCINIVLFAGGLRVVGEDNFAYLNEFINVNQTSGGQVVVSQGLVDTLPVTLEESGSVSGTLEFVDSIGAIKRFISFIINIVFTPLGLFTSAGLPGSVVLFIGAPIMLLMWLGVAYFIRSGT